MRTALRNRSNMMHKRRKNISPLIFAHLTEWIPRQVTVTNASPCAAVSLVLIVAAHEVVVMPLHRFLVRLAVAAFSVCKIRASRHAAGTLRLSRHCTSPSKKGLLHETNVRQPQFCAIKTTS